LSFGHLRINIVSFTLLADHRKPFWKMTIQWRLNFSKSILPIYFSECRRKSNQNLPICHTACKWLKSRKVFLSWNMPKRFFLSILYSRFQSCSPLKQRIVMVLAYLKINRNTNQYICKKVQCISELASFNQGIDSCYVTMILESAERKSFSSKIGIEQLNDQTYKLVAPFFKAFVISLLSSFDWGQHLLKAFISLSSKKHLRNKEK